MTEIGYDIYGDIFPEMKKVLQNLETHISSIRDTLTDENGMDPIEHFLLLLPFYVFNITDKELDEMDRDVTKFDRLKGIIDNIYVMLQEMMDTDELDGNQTGTIMLYIRNVLDKLTGKRENVRKGVEEYMGGYIIETIFDKMAQEKDELNKVIEDKNKALEKEKIENAELKDENKSLREELEKYRKQGIVIS